MADGSHLTELANLDAALAEATEARKEAGRIAKSEATSCHRSATGDLADYWDAVRFKKRLPSGEDHKRLSRELAQKVLDEGLLFDDVGGNALIIENPAALERVEKAEADYIEARTARRQYSAEFAEEIAAERGAAKMVGVRDALKGDDPAALDLALR